MISIREFSYWYPGTQRPALRKINLEIRDGEFCGIVGANGAGKSTLCYALSGFVPLFYRGDWEGEIELDGRNLGETSLGELAGQVGLVFQNPFNQISGARFTVQEEIAFGLENLGLGKREMLKRIDEALEIVQIRELAKRSPFSLSGGQQQRVAIASILAMKPKVLVLDEPTSQLDPEGTEGVFSALRSFVRKGKTTVILAEHKLEWLATFADRVIALDRGMAALEGEPEEVLPLDQMNSLGVGRTHYTEIAARLRRKGFGKRDRGLPVTLRQAKAFLR